MSRAVGCANAAQRRLLAGLVLCLAPLTHAFAACGPIGMHAHRGSATFPENSLPAVTAALDGRFDAAEIDLQLLKDRRWVLHHDAATGRIVKHGANSPVSLFGSADWQAARMLDRQGRSTREAPPFFDAVVSAAAPRLRPDGKQLNIEIKGKYACEDIRKAVAEVERMAPAGSWFFTSVDMDALRCIRHSHQDVYLGVIVAPEPEATNQRQEKAT